MITSILLAIIFSLLLVISVAAYVMRMVRPAYHHEYGGYGHRREGSILPIILLCVGIAVMVGRAWAPDTEDIMNRIVKQLSATVNTGPVSSDQKTVEGNTSNSNPISRDDLATLGDVDSYVPEKREVKPIDQLKSSTVVYGLQCRAGSNFNWAISDLNELREEYPGADIMIKEDGTGQPYKIVLYTATSKREVLRWWKAHSKLTDLILIEVPVVAVRP